MSIPPDLKVLCRKLTSTPPTQLPHSLPALIRHVLHCRDSLSAPQDQKLKADASQTAIHVHKLRTGITTLLNGRSREGRFAAIGLIKAAVDVGGWETLRGAEPWVRGLLSIVQKADPLASKELAVVALTKIYLLVHSYQTLTREIATPTLPAFIAACLQLLRPKGAAPSAPSAPSAIVETVCESFSALVPLYSTTFRPFSSQIKTAVRGFLAPTPSTSDGNQFEFGFLAPESLRRAARRLVVSLHHVAAKSSGADEWSKLLDDVLGEFHATADQVFRGVDEAWAAENGRGRARSAVVDAGGEPRGGEASADKLPPWSGLDAGVARLTGLFDYLAAILASPTKAAVAIPLGRVTETVSRVCFISRLSRSQTWEQSVETNPAIGRDEKEELWSLMPEIHGAAMRLVIALLSRLRRHMVPLIPEILDHLVRIFKSGIADPTVRSTGFRVLRAALDLAGPTLSKTSTEMLEPLIAACCRDLQHHAGVLQAAEKPKPTPATATATATATASKDPKKSSAAINTDLFLKPSTTAAGPPASPVLSTLAPDHVLAAKELLPLLFSHLPQPTLKPIIRGLLDRTAILTRHRQAMLASVLNPFKDQRGRMYPSILPHLTRLFPGDQTLEILRSNLRTSGVAAGAMFASIGELLEEQEQDPVEEEGEEEKEEEVVVPLGEAKTAEPSIEPIMAMAGESRIDLPIQVNPFEPPQREASPPVKRKLADSGDVVQAAKRQELESPSEPPRVAELPTAIHVPATTEATMRDASDDDDDDDSVHLEMVLEDDEGSEEE